MNQMSGPSAVAFDPQGRFYVADTANNRILFFAPPFSNGMNATGTFASDHNGPTNIQADPNGKGMWTYDTINFDGRIRLWKFNGALKVELPHLSNRGGGSIGIDKSGNVLASMYVYGQDVLRFKFQGGTSYQIDKSFFSPPGGYNLTTARRLEHPAWVGVGIAGNQLLVSDGRFLFWNGLNSLTNGKAPNGFVGASSATTIPDPGFGQLKVDQDSRVWITKGTEIHIYQAPLTTGNQPLLILTPPFAALGGGSITLSYAGRIAPTPHGKFLWISDPVNNRVFRIRQPLTQPLVDVVLGQLTLTDNQPNRGEIPPPNTGTSLVASLDMLASPGALSLDRNGNLYVSDHFLEADGNWRLLMFARTLFPNNPSSIIFAPSATKEFPIQTQDHTQSHATFEVAFDSTNRMVAGYNPYLGPRFVEFYNNPTLLNPSNPRDPAYALPDGQFNDFYNWPVAITFDTLDNLYAYDANRGQVRIYQTPFGAPVRITNSCVFTGNSASTLFTKHVLVTAIFPGLELSPRLCREEPLE